MYLFRMLLAASLSVQAADLLSAVEADDVKTVAQMLKDGADPNAANERGVTPLWVAAMNRNAEMAGILLKSGANPNASLPGGQTMLMAAARAGNAELVGLLAERGAHVSAAGPVYGETALMVAAMENHAEVIRVLLTHGAEVDRRSTLKTYEKDRFGLEGVVTILPPGNWTALMYAAREGAIDAARMLVEAGADIEVSDPEGTTPLLLAVVNGHYDTAAMLVEKGADVHKADSVGMTALYAAIDMNTIGEIFGRPNRKTRDTLTPLALAEVLLKRGANPNATLLKPTLQRAHTPGEGTLGAGATPIARAARTGDVAALELLIAHGGDVNQALDNGTTPLMFAAGLGRGVSAFAKDYGTEAELAAAAAFLLDHGADINAVSKAGQTAMHFAAQAADANFPQPSDDMVKLLASRGSKLDVVDSRGRDPIKMAQGEGLRGRAGGPVKPREGTIALLKELIAAQANK